MGGYEAVEAGRIRRDRHEGAMMWPLLVCRRRISFELLDGVWSSWNVLY